MRSVYALHYGKQIYFEWLLTHTPQTLKPTCGIVSLSKETKINNRILHSNVNIIETFHIIEALLELKSQPLSLPLQPPGAYQVKSFRYRNVEVFFFGSCWGLNGSPVFLHPFCSFVGVELLFCLGGFFLAFFQCSTTCILNQVHVLWVLL